ncbi:hypothetical protein JAAARDRAFT_256202 [Jaapia argillacea MUCL 33604]|uniref:DUF6697 domain-containing protein n=1 Tax=Jaapia argillacea MUCL 33604 TaxID=933084 RepID=A0A067Q3L1_9AGAM|nr:hypothetical protein JAAARDRAFT_256202 [Jaapia argillacea MUCL 33604]
MIKEKWWAKLICSSGAPSGPGKQGAMLSTNVPAIPNGELVSILGFGESRDEYVIYGDYHVHPGGELTLAEVQELPYEDKSALAREVIEGGEYRFLQEPAPVAGSSTQGDSLEVETVINEFATRMRVSPSGFASPCGSWLST